MNALITTQATMSSREIAELTGSNHDNVLKTVRSLIEKGVVFGNATPYTHPQNGQTYTEFRLSYRDTMVVVSGYSAELRAKIIDRWQALEAEVVKPRHPALPDFTDPAAAAIAWAEQFKAKQALALQAEAQAQQLAIAAPKVAALERIATASGSLCITDAAKDLQISRKELLRHLTGIGWIYRRAGGTEWLGYREIEQRGLIEHKVTNGEKSDGTEWVSTQVRITAKGLVKLSEQMTAILA